MVTISHRASVVDRKLAFPFTNESGREITREYTQLRPNEYSFGPVSPSYAPERTCQVVRGIRDTDESLEKRLQDPEFERFTIKEGKVRVTVKIQWRDKGILIPELKRKARITTKIRRF